MAGEPDAHLVLCPVSDPTHRGMPFLRPFPHVTADRLHQSRIVRAPVDVPVVPSGETRFPYRPASADWVGPAGCPGEPAVRIGFAFVAGEPFAAKPPCLYRGYRKPGS